MNTLQNKSYISHIGGLRGLAILLVILFHLFPKYLSQGFIGVDIFFVISGYLLFKGFKPDKQFLLWNFIQKKMIRIMPAFACMVLITGCCILPTLFSEDDVTILGSSMAYSIAGLSNRYYQNLYADYFSAGANMNPLLHTWYLAVTLQVYALWAIGCWAFSKMQTLRPRFGSIFLPHGGGYAQI